MGQSKWRYVGMLTIAGFATSASADEKTTSPEAGAKTITAAYGPRCFPGRRMPWQSNRDASSTSPSATPSSSDPAANSDPREASYRETSTFAGGVAGLGLSASASTSGSSTTTNNGMNPPIFSGRLTTTTANSTSPLIMPGFFTAATTQSVVPVDRIFFGYGYFDRFQVTGPGGTTPGFNLHEFNIGVEKTLLEGRASVYVSVPFLHATDNITAQPINGFGDVTAGFKLALLRDQETGNTLSLGLTVAAPTARSAVISATSAPGLVTLQQQAGIGGPVTITGTQVIPGSTASTTVNPTYFQPWVGGLFIRDRWFIHEYMGFVVPTDNRVPTVFNNNLTVGYELFRDNSGGLVTSLTPTFSAQLLSPLNHRSTQPGTGSQSVVTKDFGPSATPITVPTSVPAPALPSSFSFPDQLFLSPGFSMGLGERTVLSANLVVPVVGPRAYSVGATFGINFFY